MSAQSGTFLIGAEPGTALLHAVLAALPVIRSDRAATVEGATLTGPDGNPDLSTLDEYARPYVAEYDRVIALCEHGLRQAGLL
ncbi:MAG TPA: hypothetical protein DIT28_01315 [Oxalobacteraceae bacterium]|nr:hypothetical protein [Oxalobacteraceae bacterium]